MKVVSRTFIYIFPPYPIPAQPLSYLSHGPSNPHHSHTNSSQTKSFALLLSTFHAQLVQSTYNFVVHVQWHKKAILFYSSGPNNVYLFFPGKSDQILIICDYLGSTIQDRSLCYLAKKVHQGHFFCKFLLLGLLRQCLKNPLCSSGDVIYYSQEITLTCRSDPASPCSWSEWHIPLTHQPPSAQIPASYLSLLHQIQEPSVSHDVQRKNFGHNNKVHIMRTYSCII